MNMRISGQKLNISFSLHLHVATYFPVSYGTGALFSTDS